MKLSSYMLLLHARTSRKQTKPLYVLGIMIFFFGLFDASLSFLAPIAITQMGVSKTNMGLILGSSSLFGALFDILLSKILRDTHFRRIYLFMFLFCLLCLFFLWNASTILLIVIVMAFWGIYFDLSNFGNFDYVGRELKESEHAQGFSVIWIFRSLGYTLAPLFIGFVLGEVIDWKPFTLMGLFLSLSFGFYLLLLLVSKPKEKGKPQLPVTTHVAKDKWKHIGKFLFPVLCMTMILWITDSFFWTIGPLMSDSFSSLSTFKGLFISAYTLPPLLVGWFVGNFTAHFGKKKTSYSCLLIGGSLLSLISLLSDPLQIICLVFTSSCFFAISLPAINGAYADYIEESPELEKGIESLEDFFTNLGYIVGPIMAGLLADSFGNLKTFSLLGIIQVVLVLVLMVITPKKIKLSK